MSANKGLKAIAPVPTANDFLDIVLSKTQRKTPTVRPIENSLQTMATLIECTGYSQEL